MRASVHLPNTQQDAQKARVLRLLSELIASARDDGKLTLLYTSSVTSQDAEVTFGTNRVVVRAGERFFKNDPGFSEMTRSAWDRYAHQLGLAIKDPIGQFAALGTREKGGS